MAKPLVESGADIGGFTVGECVHRGGMATLWSVTRPELASPLLMNSYPSSEKSSAASNREMTCSSDSRTALAFRLSDPSRFASDRLACSDVRALIRSAIDSACTRSSFPLSTARSVNSPGSANRAPNAIAARITSPTMTELPCSVNSTRSFPVKEYGAS